MVGRRGRDRGEAVLITDARRSRLRNYHRRRRIYAGLQWSRIPLLLVAGASFLWWDLPWLGVVFTVLSVPMPWIAVVIANEHGDKRDRNERRVYKPGVARERERREREAAARAAELAAADPPDGESHPRLPVPWVPPDRRGGGHRPGDPGPLVIDMPED